MFSNGFECEIARELKRLISKRKRFAFVASDFNEDHSKTDKYFFHFLKMFEKIGVCFEDSYVIDGRMAVDKAQHAIRTADVIWLAGGDSPTQFGYLKEYGLVKIIQEHSGVVIGMSAGAINLAKRSICTVSSGHFFQSIYDGLGCVDISVEPHFNAVKTSNELLELSCKYLIYGLCDESMIVFEDEKVEFFGNVYTLRNGICKPISK